MLVLIAVALTVATVLVELMALYRSDSLLKTFRRNTTAAAALSVALSWMLGSIFGAAGMVVFLAAIASTVITALVYKSGLLLAVKRLGEAGSRRRSRQA